MYFIFFVLYIFHLFRIVCISSFSDCMSLTSLSFTNSHFLVKFLFFFGIKYCWLHFSQIYLLFSVSISVFLFFLLFIYIHILNLFKSISFEIYFYLFFRNGPRARGGHSFVFDEKENRFLVFGGLTSGNEVEICVNDTYQLIIQDEVFFTFNEAVSPGRLGYNYINNNNNKNGRLGSSPVSVSIPAVPAATAATAAGNNVNQSHQGSNSSNGPMAVWKKLQCTGSLPSPRWCHSSIIQGNDMIVFGGWSYERSVGISTGSNFLNDLYVLNVLTLVWTKVSTFGCLPRPRCQCACFLYQKKEKRKNDDEEYNGNSKKKESIRNYHFIELSDEKTNSVRASDSENEITTVNENIKNEIEKNQFDFCMDENKFSKDKKLKEKNENIENVENGFNSSFSSNFPLKNSIKSIEKNNSEISNIILSDKDNSLLSNKVYENIYNDKEIEKVQNQNIIFSEGLIPEKRNFLKNYTENNFQYEMKDEKLKNNGIVNKLIKNSRDEFILRDLNDLNYLSINDDNNKSNIEKSKEENYENGFISSRSIINSNINVNKNLFDFGINKDSAYIEIDSNRIQEKNFDEINNNNFSRVGDLDDDQDMDENQPVSKGYMIIFGGSSHNQEVS